jgi:hypothetical protein
MVVLLLSMALSKLAWADTPPDIVMQLVACLPINGLTEAQLKADILTDLGIAEADFPQLITKPDVEVGCTAGHETLGIWLNASGSTAALENINLLGPRTAFFAVQLTAAGANGLTQGMFNAQPHVFDDNGNPDPHGGNVLTSVALGFSSVNKEVQTTVNGHHNLGSIPVDFQIELSETLGLNGTAPECTEKTSLHYNSALWAFTALIPVPLLPVGITAAEDLFGQISSQLTSGSQAAVGCVFSSLVPTTILIPGTHQKVVVGYQGVSVDALNGIIFDTLDAGSVPKVVARTPGITPAPDFIVRVAQANDARPLTANFAITTQDLRQDPNTPLKITWSAPGSSSVSPSTDGRSAQIKYPMLSPSKIKLNTFISLGNISIKATDADGNVASGTFPVSAIIYNPTTKASSGPGSTLPKLKEQ